MKKIILFLIGIISIFSCREDKFQPNQSNKNCEVKTEITAPGGFEINQINTIQFNGGLNEIQFIDENIGYILGHNNVGGYAEIFRTDNGGITWTDLKLQNRVLPSSMFFLTKNVGFISYFGLNGNLLKTTDGGLNWIKISHQGLNGMIYHIQKDNNNNLYAILSGLKTKTVLIKSIDEAESWEVINDSPELDFSLVTFSFKLLENRIYIIGNNGKIIVTDLNGSRINMIQTNLSDIWDLEIIDHNNLVVVSSDKTIKSLDGGANWIEIYSKSARILDFIDSDKGLMILNKSYCPTDVYQANDVIAYTINGGLDWNESKVATNIQANYSDNQIRKNERYIILIGNDLYELKK